MVAAYLIAALSLSQVDSTVREPVRPYESAPPRASTDVTSAGVGGSGAEAAQPERQLGTDVNAQQPAAQSEQQPVELDGSDVVSGEEQQPPSDLEQENAALREELQKMTQVLEASRQEAATTNAQLQSIQQQYTDEQEQKRAEQQAAAEAEAARTNALQSARQALAVITPDSLHDSSAFSSALDQARTQLSRASQIRPDESIRNAQETVNRARGAFSNSDLHWTYLYAQEAISVIGAALGSQGGVGGLPQY